ncbi:MAG: hypothetical protein AB7N76_22715 [Planctomycetota bacterium]
MSRKRRQRSTTIRKRIEKQQREKDRQAKRSAKHSGQDDEVLLTMTVARGVAEACAAALADLDERLNEGPIRGWTADDLAGDHGVSWFGAALDEAAQSVDAGDCTLEVERSAKQPLLDKLNALEMAAPGLGLDWEVGFQELSRALSHAEEPPPPPPPEEGEEGAAEAQT